MGNWKIVVLLGFLFQSCSCDNMIKVHNTLVINNHTEYNVSFMPINCTETIFAPEVYGIDVKAYSESSISWSDIGVVPKIIYLPERMLISIDKVNYLVSIELLIDNNPCLSCSYKIETQKLSCWNIKRIETYNNYIHYEITDNFISSIKGRVGIYEEIH